MLLHTAPLTQTLFVDASSLDQLSPAYLIPHKGHVDVSVGDGELLLPPHVRGGAAELGVRAGEGAGESVGELRQDAADVPLRALAKEVDKKILGGGGVET